jgi:hypothetical protein
MPDMGISGPVSATVVEVLEDQHRRVAELFELVSSPDQDRPAVLHNLLKELAAHVAAERSAVAPVAADRGIGEEELPAQLQHDYERIEKLMVLVERRKFNSPDVPGLLTELKDVVGEHVDRCDAVLLPGLAERLSAEEQRELGEKVEGEDAMVTSHPHPHLLSLGPIASKLTAVASRWDRLRDRTVNNRHPEEGGDPSMGGAT